MLFKESVASTLHGMFIDVYRIDAYIHRNLFWSGLRMELAIKDQLVHRKLCNLQLKPTRHVSASVGLPSVTSN